MSTALTSATSLPQAWSLSATTPRCIRSWLMESKRSNSRLDMGGESQMSATDRGGSGGGAIRVGATRLVSSGACVIVGVGVALSSRGNLVELGVSLGAKVACTDSTVNVTRASSDSPSISCPSTPTGDRDAASNMGRPTSKPLHGVGGRARPLLFAVQRLPESSRNGHPCSCRKTSQLERLQEHVRMGSACPHQGLSDVID